jgi:hypothetical protein
MSLFLNERKTIFDTEITMFTTMRKRGDKLDIASAKCKMLQIIFPVIFQSDSDILIVMVKSTKI